MKATSLIFAAAVLAACSSHVERSVAEDACWATVGKLRPFDVNGCERNCTLIDDLEPTVSSAWMRQLLTECRPSGLDGFSVQSLNNNPIGGLGADGRGVRWQAMLEGPHRQLAFLAFDQGRLIYAASSSIALVPCGDEIQIPDTRDLVPAAVEAFEQERGLRSWLRAIPPNQVVDASLLFEAHCFSPGGSDRAETFVLTLYDSKDVPAADATTYYGGMDSEGSFTRWCESCDIDEDGCDCFQ
jgi:hypothetical protein